MWVGECRAQAVDAATEEKLGRGVKGEASDEILLCGVRGADLAAIGSETDLKINGVAFGHARLQLVDRMLLSTEGHRKRGVNERHCS